MARIEARRTGTKLTLMRVFGLVLVGIMTGRLTVGGPMDSTLASYGLLSSNDDGSSQNDAKRGTKEGGESSMLRSGGDAVADCNDEIEKAKKQERNKVEAKMAQTQSSSSSSSSSSSTEPKTWTFPDWPAVAKEELGNGLVKIGTNFVDNARELLMKDWDEFLEVYKNRPDRVNLCGIRINHAYALWTTVRALQPTTVIESGVNAGQSTYFIRRASSTTKIIAIDPLAKPICDQGDRWIDDNPALTTYYTGDKFVDFEEIQWQKMIAAKTIDPATTMVFLDDHLSVFQRFPTILKFGFRHVMLEDNYKAKEGATDGDKAGFTMKQMFSRIDADSEFLFHQLVSYSEFPPMFPSMMAKAWKGPRKRAGGFMHGTDKNTDIVAPLFRPDLNDEDRKLYDHVCKVIEVQPDLSDDKSYMQFMNYNQISYLEVRPMAPYLVKRWKSRRLR